MASCVDYRTISTTLSEIKTLFPGLTEYILALIPPLLALGVKYIQ
jgi:hypothetical protein